MKLRKSKYKKILGTLLITTLGCSSTLLNASNLVDKEQEQFSLLEGKSYQVCPPINCLPFPCPPFVPNKPELPEVPTVPEQPNTPDEPVVPETPIVPEQPSVPEQEVVAHLPYIIGYEDGTFRAERSVTREEFATMVARLLLNGESINKLSSFEDITPNRYSNIYVGYLEDLGIIQGYEDGTFRPFDAITSKEAYTIIEKVQQIRNPYTKQATFFNGDEKITRAEAVKTLNSVFERECSDAQIPNLFSDLKSDYWAYDAILFAAVEHTHIQ